MMARQLATFLLLAAILALAIALPLSVGTPTWRHCSSGSVERISTGCRP